MYTSALLTAAFAVLAFAGEQGEQGEECGSCDSAPPAYDSKPYQKQSYGQGGEWNSGNQGSHQENYRPVSGSWGDGQRKQASGYSGGGFSGKWQQNGRGHDSDQDWNSPCQNGQTDQYNGYQMKCNNQQWQHNVNGQWQTWSSSGRSYYNTQSGGGNGGGNGGGCSNGATQYINGQTQTCQNNIWTSTSTPSYSNTNQNDNTGSNSGFYDQSSGGSQQIPLQFDNTQSRNVPINKLHQYETQCTRIDIPQADTCNECNFDIKRVQCQAFGDAGGKEPIGAAFGAESGCDFGQPTKVVSLLCTVS